MPWWGSDFSGADLTGVNFQGTNLRDVNFSGASLKEIRLGQWPALKLEDNIGCCVYSADGRYLAVAAGTIIVLYDAVSRQALRRLEGHTAEVSSVAFDALGQTLA